MLVFQLLKSKLVKELQPENIGPIIVTLLVLKPLTSKFVRELQSLNIPNIFVTLLVLKPLKSKVVKDVNFSIPVVLFIFSEKCHPSLTIQQ